MSDWIDERRLEGEMGAANQPSEAAVRVAARRGWDHAEQREADYMKREGRTYKPQSWESAHALDRAECEEYAGVLLTAAHDPAHFKDPRDVSVNLGAEVDAVRDMAARMAEGGSMEDAADAGIVEAVADFLLRRFGGDRG